MTSSGRDHPDVDERGTPAPISADGRRLGEFGPYERSSAAVAALGSIRKTGRASQSRKARPRPTPSARRTGPRAIVPRMAVRTVIEHGPKDKRSVAFSIDWPGWSRGAKTAGIALETLEAYRDRYRPVAEIAGMVREFDAAGPLEIVEDRVGPGSTDFWGISFAPSSFEQGPLNDAEFARSIRLLRASWAFFDGVAARVSPEMRKGPRGGGRDRDRIIRHTIRVESEEFAKRVGLRIPEEGALTPEGLRRHRETYIETMRAYNAGEISRRMQSWTLPFLIRHSAFHTLDHAWEMEDKDLTGVEA
jgi:hypothetical protein